MLRRDALRAGAAVVWETAATHYVDEITVNVAPSPLTADLDE